MSITMIGLDTAKAVFQVHAVDGAGHLGQVDGHGLDIDVRQRDGSADAALGADGTEQVGRVAAMVAQRTRARAARRPHAGQRALLADTGFIHEQDFNGLALGCRGQAGGYKACEPVLKTACALGSLFGCCGRSYPRFQLRSRWNGSGGAPTSAGRPACAAACPPCAHAGLCPTRAQSGPAGQHSASAPRRRAPSPALARPIQPRPPPAPATCAVSGHSIGEGRTSLQARPY